jgi:Icc-related predicted phosphoesterase
MPEGMVFLLISMLLSFKPHVACEKMIKVLQIWFVILLFSSCKNMFQYSPNEIRLEAEMRDLNRKNIEKLQSKTARDTVKFILIGDSQRSYDDVADFVKEVNIIPDIDFVVLAGDITEFGMAQEYIWVHERLRNLKIPYIAVIGNHDMLANGRQIYKQMYGPENFSFSYGRAKFVCLNTNGAETGRNGTIPDLPWLQKELSSLEKYDNAFVLSHVPPFDTDFDKSLEAGYTSLLSSSNKVSMSLHGHRHSFSSSMPYEDGLPYLVVGSTKKRNYALITTSGDQVQYEERYY